MMCEDSICFSVYLVSGLILDMGDNDTRVDGSADRDRHYTVGFTLSD